MARGRGFNDLRGTVDLACGVVATQWKGMLVTRNVAARGEKHSSPEQVGVQRIMSEVTPRWRFMSEVRRAEWEAYAKMLGSAYEQGKHLTTGRIGIIPWKRGVLMAGQHAYTRCNVLAATSGLPYPRDKAPLPSAIPPAPRFKFAKWELLQNGEIAIVGELENPNLFNHYERRHRLWMDVCYLGKYADARVAMIIDAASADGKFSLTAFRASPSRYGKNIVNFNELNGGFVLLQAETVIADSPEHGAIRSAGSELVELQLPPQAETSRVVALRDLIRSKGSEGARQIYRRRRALNALLDTIADKVEMR